MKGYRILTSDNGGEFEWQVEECEVVLRTTDDEEAYKTKSEALKEVRAMIRSRAEHAQQMAEDYKRKAQRLRDKGKGL